MSKILSAPDPFSLADDVSSFKATAGLASRSFAIDPTKNTLVLLTAGQSLLSNAAPSAFVPVNAAVIDQMNLRDGALYSISGPLLGSTLYSTNLGNPSVRLADFLIQNYNRVILVSTNIGSTTIADWTSGFCSQRIPVALRRLAARGIVPGMTGVTFALVLSLGEQDLVNGTSQATFTAGMNSFFAATNAAGFSGKFYVASESARGQTSNAIRSAQAAVINNTTIFFGGNYDDASVSTYDGVHPDDNGSISMAGLTAAAMIGAGLSLDDNSLSFDNSTLTWDSF